MSKNEATLINIHLNFNHSITQLRILLLLFPLAFVDMRLCIQNFFLMYRLIWFIILCLHVLETFSFGQPGNEIYISKQCMSCFSSFLEQGLMRYLFNNRKCPNVLLHFTNSCFEGNGGR